MEGSQWKSLWSLSFIKGQRLEEDGGASGFWLLVSVFCLPLAVNPGNKNPGVPFLHGSEARC